MLLFNSFPGCAVCCRHVAAGLCSCFGLVLLPWVACLWPWRVGTGGGTGATGLGRWVRLTPVVSGLLQRWFEEPSEVFPLQPVRSWRKLLMPVAASWLFLGKRSAFRVSFAFSRAGGAPDAGGRRGCCCCPSPRPGALNAHTGRGPGLLRCLHAAPLVQMWPWRGGREEAPRSLT